jgi:hypothetical protein
MVAITAAMINRLMCFSSIDFAPVRASRSDGLGTAGSAVGASGS